MCGKVFEVIRKKKNSVEILNAVKRSSIAEHLVNNHNCAENLNLDKFKIIKSRH